MNVTLCKHLSTVSIKPELHECRSYCREDILVWQLGVSTINLQLNV